jgi:hypothetical protein
MCRRDRSPDSRRNSMGLHLPTQMGSGLSQTLDVAYSCGAVAAFHRASRSSRQRIVGPILTSPPVLEFNTSLSTDSLLKGMFDLTHFSYKVCKLHNFWLGIAPRQDDMKHRWLITQELNNVCDR